MTMALKPELLREVSMFRLLDDEVLAELAKLLDERRYEAGETIFKWGDPGGEMHVVTHGRVELSIADGVGRRTTLGCVEGGEIFGELSLFDGQARSVTAVALQATDTAVINRDDFAQLVRLRPDTALDILATVSGRLRQADLMLVESLAQNANKVIEERLTFGDRVADAVARVGGSWIFINVFVSLMLVWMGLNTWQLLGREAFDPPPFIGLNLLLSMVAALQAPIIMMSQNRQDAKDRVRAEVEYEVNIRAELEVMQLHQKVDQMREEIMGLLHAGPRP
jgi:CRP/FNR family cyclic AMP-dependent transcriptional regulator